jgi:uncharacterized protein involved in exopolysaccharide biosynthesis
MQKSYVEPPVRPLLPEQLSFLAIINFVLRNLPLMLVLGVILSGVLVLRAIRKPVTYTSTSYVSTGEEATGNRILSFLGGGSSFSNPGSQALIDLMTAPALLEQLARVEFDFPNGRTTALKQYGGDQPPDRAMESAVGALGSKIDAKLQDPSGWIELTTQGETATVAQQLNTALLAQVDSFNAQKRRRLSIENQKFAEERLAEYGAQVRAAEARLQSFEETNRDLTPPGIRLQHQRLQDSVARVKSIYGGILSSYDRERLDAERQLKPLTLMKAPNLPYAPVKRNIARTIILGLFAGGFLGGVIGAIREYFRSIRKQDSPEYAEYRALIDRWFGWVPKPKPKR